MFGRKPLEIIIQTAKSEDVPQLAVLHKEAFRRGWDQTEFSTLLEKPENVLYVARQVGKPKAPLAGFNIMQQLPHEAEILSIAVDSSVRGRDVGEQLMRAAINQLLADKVPALLLEVDELNLAALALYRKLGFKQVGSRPGYYRAVDPVAGSVQRSSALVMRLDLNDDEI